MFILGSPCSILYKRYEQVYLSVHSTIVHIQYVQVYRAVHSTIVHIQYVQVYHAVHSTIVHIQYVQVYRVVHTLCTGLPCSTQYYSTYVMYRFTLEYIVLYIVHTVCTSLPAEIYQLVTDTRSLYSTLATCTTVEVRSYHIIYHVILYH